MNIASELPPLGIAWPFAYSKLTGPDIHSSSDYCIVSLCKSLSPSVVVNLLSLSSMGIPADIENFTGGAGLYRPHPGELLAVWYRRSPVIELGRGYFLQTFGLLLSEETFQQYCRGHYKYLPCPYASERQFSAKEEVPPIPLSKSDSKYIFELEAQSSCFAYAKSVPEETIAKLLTNVLSDQPWLLLNFPGDENSRLEKLDGALSFIPLSLRERMTFSTVSFNVETTKTRFVFPAQKMRLPSNVISRYCLYDTNTQNLSGACLAPANYGLYLARAIQTINTHELLSILDGFECSPICSSQEALKKLETYSKLMTEQKVVYKKGKPDQVVAYVNDMSNRLSNGDRLQLIYMGMKKASEERNVKGILALLEFAVTQPLQSTYLEELEPLLFDMIESTVDNVILKQIYDGLYSIWADNTTHLERQTRLLLSEVMGLIARKIETRDELIRQFSELCGLASKGLKSDEFAYLISQLLVWYFKSWKEEKPGRLGPIISLCLDNMTTVSSIKLFLFFTSRTLILSQFRAFLKNCIDPELGIDLQLIQSCASANNHIPSAEKYTIYELGIKPNQLITNSEIIDLVASALDKRILLPGEARKLLSKCTLVYDQAVLESKLRERHLLDRLLVLIEKTGAKECCIYLLSMNPNNVGDGSVKSIIGSLSRICQREAPSEEERDFIMQNILKQPRQTTVRLLKQLLGAGGNGNVLASIGLNILKKLPEPDFIDSLEENDWYEIASLLLKHREIQAFSDIPFISSLWAHSLGSCNQSSPESIRKSVEKLSRITGLFRNTDKEVRRQRKKIVQSGAIQWCDRQLRTLEKSGDFEYYVWDIMEVMLYKKLYDEISWMAPMLLSRICNASKKMFDRLLLAPFEQLDILSECFPLSRNQQREISYHLSSLSENENDALRDALSFALKQVRSEARKEAFEGYLTRFMDLLDYPTSRKSDEGAAYYSTVIDSIVAICFLKGLCEEFNDNIQTELSYRAYASEQTRRYIRKYSRSLREKLVPRHLIPTLRRSHSALFDYLEGFTKW